RARVANRPAVPAPAPATAPLPSIPEEPRPDAPRASTSLLTAEQVLARGAASLGDTLGTTPGVSATSFSPVASRPVIRGLGGFRVRTQEDGIGSHDMANLGEDHAVTIDPLAAGRAEVMRGPGTLRYGSQAIGGGGSASNNRSPPATPQTGAAIETRRGRTSVHRRYD